MRRFVLAILTGLTADPALSGAWARDEGQLFIAAGGNFLLSEGARLPVHYDPTLYAEYGLTPRLTIGLNFYTADAGQTISALGFVRTPIGDATGRVRQAVTLGFGGRRDPYNPAETLVELGYSWGYGMDNGWLSVDASATAGVNDRTFRPKADFTWGQNWTDTWATMVQLQTGQGLSDDYYAKISPAIIYTVNDWTRMHLGAVHALTGDRGSALKLETWLVF